jgi:cytochrome o ubiquinol oxidase subunit 2
VRTLHRCTILLAPLCLTACQAAVLDPQGTVGVAEKTILLDSLAIMLAIVLPTIAATLGFAWWFRAGNTRAHHLPDWSHSGKLELIVWAIPLLTIMLLGGVAWVGSHLLDPARPLASSAKPLNIQVVSLDWKFLFIYPDQGIGSVNTLVIPAGVPVHFSLTSASVMNAFFIAPLGSMIYMMNGMATQLNLSADKPGLYHGISSHFSGDGFADMHFDVHAVPSSDFSAWIASVRSGAKSLTPQSYATLARQSIAVPPFTYHAVDAGLFDKIVSQDLAPGPGPTQ